MAMKKKFNGTHEEYLELQKSYIHKTKGRTGNTCPDKLTYARMRAQGDYLLFKSRFWRYRAFIEPEENAVLLGARLGTEVYALRDLGHKNCIGMDVQTEYANDINLVEYGDFMDLRYPDNSIQFVYTNCFDHLTDPLDFIEGLEVVMKTNSFALFDVDDQHISKRGFSGWDMYEPEDLKELLGILEGKNRHIVSMEESYEPFAGGGQTVLLKFGEAATKEEEQLASAAKSHHARQKSLFETENPQRFQYSMPLKLTDKMQEGLL